MGWIFGILALRWNWSGVRGRWDIKPRNARVTISLHSSFIAPDPNADVAGEYMMDLMVVRGRVTEMGVIVVDVLDVSRQGQPQNTPILGKKYKR